MGSPRPFKINGGLFTLYPKYILLMWHYIKKYRDCCCIFTKLQLLHEFIRKKVSSPVSYMYVSKSIKCKLV
jgi:hypothetical protein